MVKIQSIQSGNDSGEAFTFTHKKEGKGEQNGLLGTAESKAQRKVIETERISPVGRNRSVFTFNKTRNDGVPQIDSDREDTLVLLACLNEEQQLSELEPITVSFKETVVWSQKKISKISRISKGHCFEDKLNDSIDFAIISKVKNKRFRRKKKRFTCSTLFDTVNNVLSQRYLQRKRVPNVFKAG